MSARVYVRFYAELNDFLRPELRATAIEHSFFVPPTARDIIESHGVPHTEVDLILANGESVDFAYRVAGGDRLSVYPMFEAIDISPIVKVRPEPLRDPRFVLDTHLGRLAAYLRMAGFDAGYSNQATDAQLARISAEERRILLTRDRGLLKRGAVTHGYCIREADPSRQLAEVVCRFDLAGRLKPFTRCLRCNVLLESAAAPPPDLPDRVRQRHTAFFRCPRCARFYWEGTHHQRMLRLLDSVTKPCESLSRES